MNRLLARAHHAQRFGSAGRRNDRVSIPFERLAGQRPYLVIVFDEEDRFGRSSEHGNCRGGLRRLRLVIHPREINLEGRPVARLAIDPDIAPALLDDPEDGGQAQLGPPAPRGVLRGLGLVGGWGSLSAGRRSKLASPNRDSMTRLFPST